MRRAKTGTSGTTMRRLILAWRLWHCRPLGYHWRAAYRVAGAWPRT